MLVDIETLSSPVTRNLPAEFVAPESEWYQWNPSPRENADVEILASISPKNYPLGIKDVINYGDFPIAWRNKNYRMVYLNYGHGDREFTDATQNLLTLNAFRYVVSLDPNGDPFTKQHQTATTKRLPKIGCNPRHRVLQDHCRYIKQTIKKSHAKLHFLEDKKLCILNI